MRSIINSNLLVLIISLVLLFFCIKNREKDQQEISPYENVVVEGLDGPFGFSSPKFYLYFGVGLIFTIGSLYIIYILLKLLIKFILNIFSSDSDE